MVDIRPPEPFNSRTPDDWPCWRHRFLQFQEVNGSEETKQISTFLYCLGEEAEAVLSSTNATADDRSFFKVRKNIIYERSRFNR